MFEYLIYFEHWKAYKVQLKNVYVIIQNKFYEFKCNF